DARTGELLALIEADRMGQIRTGAATGVATACLAADRRGLRVGIYGAGWQAQSQLEAVCAVRAIVGVRVYSRTAEKRDAFCRDMTARLGVPVEPAERPEDAAAGAEIVITATTAREPVLRGEWLMPGAHVNAVGGNLLMKREIDDAVIARSGLIVVDSIEQARVEAGDLLAPFERGLFRWEQVRELYEIVAGSHPGRMAEDQITLFKSIGIALEDVAVAARIYRNAIEQGAGSRVPMWAG
ncbi:MAG TPA: ornithine cyclodeaminase family protein, partial [Chthonomonadaceae bacterium]|nr:ornithine cyclodeaminase family protein [Chthonomonadaceae bacterium]